ncbi:hypothetical protein [Pontibacter chinhatensis]|uniref:Uncharacterized protein n=1 Tax=Pontibacter chinhatensis TaxID=1436961 RepID=A0A1I2TB20_9BACT|nr:hypothetical protein [Pontibacter chinhatensis]SFG62010.1 hypothetical protein SAMN05421739_10348 [Pontibacter chinhatensis]
MKQKILLCLSLCLLLWGCKDDDTEPASVSVTMSSSSKTLEEGGEAVELTVELDRTYKDLRFLYLEGASELLDRDVPHHDGWITLEVDGKPVNLLRIPIPAGHKQRTISLRVAKDEVYQGNYTSEIKLYSFENEVVIPKTSLAIDYLDATPKPVFGIVKHRESDVARTAMKGNYISEGFYIGITADRAFTRPQKITLAFSGTAQEGTHYEKEAHVVLDPIFYRSAWNTSTPIVLRILQNGLFVPEKTIHIKLSAAEEGVIANGEAYNFTSWGSFTLENSFTLTVTE